MTDPNRIRHRLHDDGWLSAIRTASDAPVLYEELRCESCGPDATVHIWETMMTTHIECSECGRHTDYTLPEILFPRTRKPPESE